MKEHMFQWKKLFIRIFLLNGKLLKHLWKRNKMGKTYTRCWTLGWGSAEVPCLYEKGNKGYKEIDQMENAWRVVEHA